MDGGKERGDALPTEAIVDVAASVCSAVHNGDGVVWALAFVVAVAGLRYVRFGSVVV